MSSGVAFILFRAAVKSPLFFDTPKAEAVMSLSTYFDIESLPRSLVACSSGSSVRTITVFPHCLSDLRSSSACPVLFVSCSKVSENMMLSLLRSCFEMPQFLFVGIGKHPAIRWTCLYAALGRGVLSRVAYGAAHRTAFKVVSSRVVPGLAYPYSRQCARKREATSRFAARTPL